MEGSKALLSTPGHEARLHLAQARGAPPELSEDVPAPSCRPPTLTPAGLVDVEFDPAAPCEVSSPDVVGAGEN